MKNRSDQGVSAIEFALVLPLLLILVFGIIEFSFLLFDKAVITNASREGARAGIVYSTDGENPIQVSDDTIRAVVRDYVNDDGGSSSLISLGSAGPQTLQDGDIAITRADPDGDGVEDLTVRVTYTYTFLLFPNMAALVGGNFQLLTVPLIGETLMRME
ncbi:TadE/TadG family type IV pilus assembly protein [Desulfotalea psychrophila]|uniref:TadE-like domain-containing protein n=1 Tax=Desulfotalea psychrophila (strain LSv54 / DSM 12343) TaxID=177439 RepID=Q6AN12_DESPS|nr:TadE/TadG family type IV pilus assembly protein [Desulfotalea psychrophila]CAG36262.1 unknown protein [Desulfotalea psychrophila LSv54]